MDMQEYRYDDSRLLCLKETPTGAEPAAKKKELVARTEQNMAQCALLQEKLYAAGREGLVIAIQARDAAGKDSLIKKVFGKLNPAALEVHSFKAPSKEELQKLYGFTIALKETHEELITGYYSGSHYSYSTYNWWTRHPVQRYYSSEYTFMAVSGKSGYVYAEEATEICGLRPVITVKVS